MIKLTALQAKVYEYMHSRYAGKTITTSGIVLAPILDMNPVTINQILRLLVARGIFKANYAPTTGLQNEYRVPKKRLAYTRGNSVSIIAKSRHYDPSGMEGSKQRVLELINKNATPDRATAWKLTQRQIAAALGLSTGYVFQLIKELEREGKIVKANHTDRGGKSTVYDQSDTIAVTIDGKRALIQGRFTVSFPPAES